jgi:hypothetical protein
VLPAHPNNLSFNKEKMHMSNGVDTAADKSEIYRPSDEVVANANVPDYLKLRQDVMADPAAFWDERAKELTRLVRALYPGAGYKQRTLYKWFADGKTNIVHNALDRHAESWRKNKLALIWEGEDGEQRNLQLLQALERGQPLRQHPQEHGRQEG